MAIEESGAWIPEILEMLERLLDIVAIRFTHHVTDIEIRILRAVDIYSRAQCELRQWMELLRSDCQAYMISASVDMIWNDILLTGCCVKARGL